MSDTCKVVISSGWSFASCSVVQLHRQRQSTLLLQGSHMLLQLTDADETAGIIAVCEQLIDHSPRMKILLMAVLPRGNQEVEAPAVKSLLPNK